MSPAMIVLAGSSVVGAMLRANLSVPPFLTAALRRGLTDGRADAAARNLDVAAAGRALATSGTASPAAPPKPYLRASRRENRRGSGLFMATSPVAHSCDGHRSLPVPILNTSVSIRLVYSLRVGHLASRGTSQAARSGRSSVGTCGPRNVEDHRRVYLLGDPRFLVMLATAEIGSTSWLSASSSLRKRTS